MVIVEAMHARAHTQEMEAAPKRRRTALDDVEDDSGAAMTADAWMCALGAAGAGSSSRRAAPRSALDEVEDSSPDSAMSAEAWMRLLGTPNPRGGAGAATSPRRPHAPSSTGKAAPRNLSYSVAEGETACMDNCAAHTAYGDVELRLLDAAHGSSSADAADSDAADDIKPLPLHQRVKPSEYYDRYVARTPEQCDAERSAPQRSDAWLDARRYSITASQFGGATGESPYQTPEDVVVDKVWNTFKGNAATEWGTTHEPHAKEAFCAWFTEHLRGRGLSGEFRFIEENLLKFAEEPWMAVSPDGIVEYVDESGNMRAELVEFKCPAYLRHTPRHPYAKWPANTPSYYRSQIQGIMGYLNAHHPRWAFRHCWFVVWQPHQTWITLHAYDAAYYTDALHPALRDWYFTRLLPAMTAKHNGLLARGDIHPQEPITL